MTVGVLSLAEFLLARIAEDQAEAEKATTRLVSLNNIAALDLEYDVEHDRDLTLVVDPDRVLAECAAKRAIVEMFQGAEDEARRSRNLLPKGASWGLRDATAALASAYRDHEDFDESWTQ